MFHLNALLLRLNSPDKRVEFRAKNYEIFTFLSCTRKETAMKAEENLWHYKEGGEGGKK